MSDRPTISHERREEIHVLTQASWWEIIIKFGTRNLGNIFCQVCSGSLIVSQGRHMAWTLDNIVSCNGLMPDGTNPFT